MKQRIFAENAISEFKRSPIFVKNCKESGKMFQTPSTRWIKKLKNCCNDFFFVLLAILTIGGTSAILLAAIILLAKLPLAGIDTTILTWLIVAFCISIVVLIYSVSILFWNWKYSKLCLAIILGLFDIFLLILAIVLLTLKDSTLSKIEVLWSNTPKSSLVDFIEKTYKCCGFDVNTSDHCGVIDKTNSDQEEYRLPLCNEVLLNIMNNNRMLIGIILLVIEAILLGCDIIAFYNGIKECRNVLEPEFSDIPPNSTLLSPNWW